jgi:hypothetical protein
MRSTPTEYAIDGIKKNAHELQKLLSMVISVRSKFSICFTHLIYGMVNHWSMKITEDV